MNGHTLNPESLFYGTDEAQHLSLSWPANVASPRGVVALIHGGYWRSSLYASLMEPLAASLLENGWAVANIEYRRGASGPWPAPLEDCRQALSLVEAVVRERRLQGPAISIGHSVGGQLALLTAGLADAVVALAPVTDAERTYNEALGENAAREYFGTSPAETPGIYRQASAVRQLPIHTPTLLIHGANDSRVPIGHSRDYVHAAQAAGSPVFLREYKELSHLEDIDPLAAHWPDVLAWIAGVSASDGAKSEQA
ncbi:alpha/beta hydrolase [Paeniglutamicibacter kerguelensis]|uniref:Acetyl esterase/lipase n=1 Tax=Paeniglutamicibacter kerguelensis TaxID=254788 RepID=A0ABS4X8H7_9MICC|nr:alpha/beta fold hydrolase [Paeniglutamicibacter kerguelensis]MBP2384763.1 acetyl esterase/lipase [Paeniglutamicibacter kerguelensis]